MGRPNATRTGPRFGNFIVLLEDLFQAFEPDGDDGYAEPDADHAHPGHKAVDPSVLASATFRKNEHRVPVGNHFPDVAQRLPGARLSLGEREGIEELA